MTTAAHQPATIAVVELVVINKGNLKAFVDVRIGLSSVVRKCRVAQQPGQRAWVNMPQER
jgi:DNA-binding cell septation regulator SpoVG